jgi:hypothetical protein
LIGPSEMWTTYIGKRKQKTLTRKDKGKKPKVMDGTLLESDEFTPSLNEECSPAYQESNLSSLASSDDDDDDNREGGGL